MDLYIDDRLCIIDNTHTLTTIIQLTVEEEVNKKLNFLNIQTIQNKNNSIKLTYNIYRNKTTSNIIILYVIIQSILNNTK